MAKRVFENREGGTPSQDGRLTGARSELPKSKKSDKKLFTIVMVVVCLLLISAAVFVFMAFKEKHEDSQIDNMWDGVREIAGVATMGESSHQGLIGRKAEAEDEIDSVSDDVAPGYFMSEAYSKDPLARVIDWDALWAINEDVLCWVYIPGTQVDYPVMQEQVYDESFYQTHNIYKAKQKSGAVFTPAQYSPDIHDMHMLLYGHHMKSGSMFGSLTKYKDKKYYEEHPYVYLYYPDRTEVWEVWVAEQVKSSYKVYIIPYYEGSVEYNALLKELEENSLYKTPKFGVDAVTKTLFLTTCDHSKFGQAGRFVLGTVMKEAVKPGNGYVPAETNVKDKASVSNDVAEDRHLILSDDDYEGYDFDEGSGKDVLVLDSSEVLTLEDDEEVSEDGTGTEHKKSNSNGQ